MIFLFVSKYVCWWSNVSSRLKCFLFWSTLSYHNGDIWRKFSMMCFAKNASKLHSFVCNSCRWNGPKMHRNHLDCSHPPPVIFERYPGLLKKLFSVWKSLNMRHLNFGIFLPIFVLFKLTCLVTLFDRKLQAFKKLAKLTLFGIFYSTFVRSICKRSSQCWMRLFLWFSNTAPCWHMKNLKNLWWHIECYLKFLQWQRCF